MKSKVLAVFFCIAFMGSIGSNVSAQKRAAEMKKLEIKVSVVCKQCKDRIEKAMAYEKGVKDFNIDLKTKILTLTYQTSKTSPEKIKLSISKLGHDADEVKADKKAFDKLPACCRGVSSCH